MTFHEWFTFHDVQFYFQAGLLVLRSLDSGLLRLSDYEVVARAGEWTYLRGIVSLETMVLPH